MRKYKYCEQCPLINKPIVLPQISTPTDILFVGETPGYHEARSKRPFSGDSGRLLRRVIATDVNKELMCSYTNALICYSGGKAPANKVIRHCMQKTLVPLIERLKPKRIVLLGNAAAGAFGFGWSGILNKRGQFVEWNGYDVFLTVNPAYILRAPDKLEMFRRDIRKAVRPINKENTEPKHIVLDTPESASEYLNSLTHGLVALDTETTGTNPWRDELICISITDREDIGYVIYRNILDDPSVKKALLNLFARGISYDQIETYWNDPKSVDAVIFIMHNAKFDQKFLLTTFGQYPPLTADTMIMHSEIFVGEQHGLKFVATDLCDAPAYDSKLNKTKKKGTFLTVPYKVLSKYAAYDAVYTLRAFHTMLSLVDDRLRRMIIRKTQVSWALLDVEINGILVDTDSVLTLSTELKTRIDRIEQEARELVDEPTLNLRSTQQVAKVIYDKLALTPRNLLDDHMAGRRQVSHKNRPARTTDAEYLRTVSHHRFPQLVLEHREATKLYSTYVRKLTNITDGLGRVHTSFNIWTTVTGRLSSSNPNMQNLPHTGGVRELFVPPVGCVMLELDYSQAEYRVVAALSRDNWMIEQYRSGKDLHDEVARAIFGENYTKVQRVAAKAINFGLLYGMSARSLAEGQGISLHEAEAYKREYFKRVPGLRTWLATQKATARSGKPIKTKLGRQWVWRVITKNNKSEIERYAVNYPVQYTAATLLLIALVEIWRTLHLENYARIVTTVHDSIFLVTLPENVESVALTAKAIMERVPLAYLGDLVPFVADVSIGSAMKPMDKYVVGMNVNTYVRRDR